MSRKYTREQVLKCIEGSKTPSECLSKLGVPPIGGNYPMLYNLLKWYNISVPFRIGATRVKSNLKKKLINDRGHKCEMCLNTEWLEDPIPLELHHIDGNPDNNVDSNLMLLCPNCHAKTDNYKSKNRQINKKTYVCSECGKVLNSASMTGLCITCLRKSLKNPVRPSKEELEELLKTNSKTALGKKFGVSGRTILKWYRQDHGMDD